MYVSVFCWAVTKDCSVSKITKDAVTFSCIFVEDGSLGKHNWLSFCTSILALSLLSVSYDEKANFALFSLTERIHESDFQMISFIP